MTVVKIRHLLTSRPATQQAPAVNSIAAQRMTEQTGNLSDRPSENRWSRLRALLALLRLNPGLLADQRSRLMQVLGRPSAIRASSP